MDILVLGSARAAPSFAVYAACKAGTLSFGEPDGACWPCHPGQLHRPDRTMTPATKTIARVRLTLPPGAGIRSWNRRP